jgi:two-component system CheB/CheR fusion protein
MAEPGLQGEAMRRFFAAVPANPGMAFVAVLHLSPDHQSHVSQMLGKVAKLPVQEVRTDTPIEPDHIYVIAPDTALTMEGARSASARPAGGRAIRSTRFSPRSRRSSARSRSP